MRPCGCVWHACLSVSLPSGNGHATPSIWGQYSEALGTSRRSVQASLLSTINLNELARIRNDGKTHSLRSTAQNDRSRNRNDDESHESSLSTALARPARYRRNRLWRSAFLDRRWDGLCLPRRRDHCKSWRDTRRCSGSRQDKQLENHLLGSPGCVPRDRGRDDRDNRDRTTGHTRRLLGCNLNAAVRMPRRFEFGPSCYRREFDFMSYPFFTEVWNVSAFLVWFLTPYSQSRRAPERAS